MKLIMILAAGICIGMVVVLTLSSNPFSPFPRKETSAPVSDKNDVRPQSIAGKKAELPTAHTLPAISARPTSPPAIPEDETVRPVTVLRIDPPKAPITDMAEDEGFALKVREKTLAATVLLHVEQQGNSFEGCGFYCASGVIAANARILGFDLKTREPIDKRAINAIAYGVTPDPTIQVAQVTAYDPESGLVFLTVPTRTASPVPLPLADGVIPTNALVYIPRFQHGNTVNAAVETGHVTEVWTDPAGLHSFISIDSEFASGSSGSPCVDVEGHVVAIAGAGRDEALRGAVIHCDAVRNALKGRLGAVTVRKIEEHAGGLYSFEVSADSLDPADRIRTAFFYYWTVKPGASGSRNSGSMIRNLLTRAPGSNQWIGTVSKLALPPGSKIWTQSGYALTGRQQEVLSEPFECAVGLGIPDAPVVASAQTTDLPLSRVENIPRGEETPFGFVGTQPTYSTIEYITTTTSGGTTTVQTTVTNTSPQPPPDSPGWTFGYTTDYSTYHPSRDYETAKSNNYWNTINRPTYYPLAYYSANSTPVYTNPLYTMPANSSPRYYSPLFYTPNH